MVFIVVEYFRGKFLHHVLRDFSSDEVLSFVKSYRDRLVARETHREQDPLWTTSLKTAGDVKGFRRREVPMLRSH